MTEKLEKTLMNSFEKINYAIIGTDDPSYQLDNYDSIEFYHCDIVIDPKILFTIPHLSKGTAISIAWAYYRDEIYSSMPCSDYWMDLRIKDEVFAIINCYGVWIGKEAVDKFYKEGE